MALLPWPDSPCAHGRSVAPGAQQEAAGATIRGRVQEQPVHTEAAEVGDEVRIASVSGLSWPVFAAACSVPRHLTAFVFVRHVPPGQDFVRHPKFSSVHDRTGIVLASRGTLAEIDVENVVSTRWRTANRGSSRRFCVLHDRHSGRASTILLTTGLRTAWQAASFAKEISGVGGSASKGSTKTASAVPGASQVPATNFAK
jgi:hypothetical protein